MPLGTEHLNWALKFAVFISNNDFSICAKYSQTEVKQQKTQYIILLFSFSSLNFLDVAAHQDTCIFASCLCKPPSVHIY